MVGSSGSVIPGCGCVPIEVWSKLKPYLELHLRIVRSFNPLVWRSWVLEEPVAEFTTLPSGVPAAMMLATAILRYLLGCVASGVDDAWRMSQLVPCS